MTELSYIVHLILCSGVASNGALGHVPLLDSAKNVRPVTRPASIYMSWLRSVLRQVCM